MTTKAKSNHAGFWRRLAALWADVFVIYSLTTFLIALLSITGFRISSGTLFIFVGAVYSIVMLSYRRQTAGKMLMQTMVTSETGDTIRFRDILLRELYGKWGMTVFMPMMLGLFFCGSTWLPTVFDLLIMIPVVAFCILWYLFTKRIWYEQLAGLKVTREPLPKNIKPGFLVLIFAAILGTGTVLTEYLAMHRVPCRVAAFQDIRSTGPYVNFLKKQHTGPVDYVIGLFDKYDVVVLCERAHPEMTQWDFIYDIVRDPRFIGKAGHVFTEYGHTGMQDYMDKFMLTDSLDAAGVREHVMHIMHNMPVWPSWSNYNLYQYLTRLYYLNQKLPPGKRVRHHFTDAAMDWSAIKTVKDYQEYQKNFLWHRDEIMAGTIIREMRDLSKDAAKPPKCLVIMNYRHAMDLTDRLPDVTRGNTFEFLKDSFGTRTVNVLINTRFILSVPVASGVWDAAFKKTGNKPVGFNFQGSPFGACYFDLFPFDVLFQPVRKSNNPSSNGSLRYQDVFTGFVFTNPVKDQYLRGDTPGYFDGFEDEYARRYACLPGGSKEAAMMQMKASKENPVDEARTPVEFTIETVIELCFYGISAVGLLIGLAAFIFAGHKKPEDTTERG